MAEFIGESIIFAPIFLIFTYVMRRGARRPESRGHTASAVACVTGFVIFGLLFQFFAWRGGNNNWGLTVLSAIWSVIAFIICAFLDKADDKRVEMQAEETSK